MSQETKDRSHLPAWIDELDAMTRVEGPADSRVTVEFPDGSEPLSVSRREFMRVASVAAAAAGVTAACRTPEEKIVPYVRRRDGVYHDKPLSFMSVCDGCATQCGVQLTVREGRVVKLEGNAHHPVNRGALCARGQGAVIDLYSPDRVRAPLAVASLPQTPAGETSWAALAESGKTTWEALDGAAVAALKKGGKVRVLLSQRTGVAQLKALDTFLGAFGDAQAVLYQPLAPEAGRKANQLIYGRTASGRVRFDRAKAVVSVGGAFLDTDGAVTQHTRHFARTRNPDGEMSRLHIFESRLTLTGAAADRRTPVRPSDQLFVALAVANELILVGGLGPKDDAAVKAALSPYTAEKVAGDLGIDAALIKEAAADLKAAGAQGLFFVGERAGGDHGVALHGVAALINEALGNSGVTVEGALPTYGTGVDIDPALGLERVKSGWAAFTALLQELPSTDLLIIDGVNPVYDAPTSLNVAQAIGQAKEVITLDLLLTETARAGKWVGAASHFLEAWGDAHPGAGLYSIRQPGLLPLHDTRTLEDCLLIWGAAASEKMAADPGVKAAMEAHAGYKDPMNRPSPGPFYFFLQGVWQRDIYPAARTSTGFAKFWESALREGVHYAGAGKESGVFARARYAEEAPRYAGPEAPKGSFAEVLKAVPASRPAPKGELEVELFPTIALWDGRQASNGVLQECPDPVAQVTWGNYAAIGAKRFKAMGLKIGQVVEVQTEQGSLKLPAVLMPGLHNDTIAIPVGYGRTSAGLVGSDIGANAWALAKAGADSAVLGGAAVTLTATAEMDPIGQAEGKGHVINLHDRPIVPLTTLAEYKKDPGAGKHEHKEPGFWGNAGVFPKEEIPWGQDHHYEKSKWEMAIDLSRCTGCSACVVACQVENNIPVVGKSGVIQGRSMHWIRIDRYYQLPERDDHGSYTQELLDQHPEVAAADYLENPVVLVEPMLCQHCSNAPCESVCPVLATVHSDDGLNEQVYNRCVGTRYCANNCPYKVRRFNWFNYSEDRSESVFADLFPQLKDHATLNVQWPLTLKFNPEVTVRARGVMEKCSFCVQRIRRRSYTHRKLGIAARQEEVKTACQQTCPADAITFGDIRDQGSPIVQQINSARSFTILSHLNVQPGVKYLTRVRNV